MPALERPLIRVEIVFLRAEEGGHVQLPPFEGHVKFRPHLVIQDRSARRFDPSDQYKGVWFREALGQVEFDAPAHFVLDLMYFPDVSYDDVQPGASFTIREGARIVAHGVVIERFDPPEH